MIKESNCISINRGTAETSIIHEEEIIHQIAKQYKRVFDTDDGYGKYDKRIKLLKSTAFGATWDSNNKNDWAISTLNSYLNDNYYNQIF